MPHTNISTRNSPSDQALRLKLLKGGYTPLPAKGKAVTLTGWPQIAPTDSTVRGWSKTLPDHVNTGIRTGDGIVGVDIDVLNEAVANHLAKRLENLTKGKELPPIRFGRKPKCLLIMRVDEDGPKMMTGKYRDCAGKEIAQIEVLADGQQFIAFGIHPDTGQEYEWPDLSPLDVATSGLPTITRAALKEFLAYAAQEFEAMGWTAKSANEKPRAVVEYDYDDLSEDEWRSLLAELSQDSAWLDDREGWIRVGMALNYAFDGSNEGLELWIGFSQDSEKFNQRELKKQWQSFKDAPNPVTVGTLIKGAPDWAKARRHAENLALAGELLNEDDLEDADRLPAKTRGKHKSLMVDPKGRRLNNLANAAHWLRSNEAFGGLLCFDEMNMEAVIRQTSGKIMPLMDHQITALTETLQRDGIKEISSAKVAEAANLVAHENPFHPLRDWLRGLVWDGRKRLSTWLPDYLGTADTEYTRAVGRMFLVSMVARVMQPGAKVDHMMILEGEQGVGKSTVARILAGTEYFSDDLPAMNAGKDLLQHLRGKWLIEVAELDKMRLADVNATKAFLTKSEDRFRAPYARVEETHPRQCVFFGTTNEDQYLRDSTGARRFWPVMVGAIDLHGVKKARDQFFAEAVYAFDAGENWWPDREFEQEIIRPKQDSKYIADIWTDPVRDWIERNAETRFRLDQVLHHAVGIEIGRAGMNDQRRMGTVLRLLGCEGKKTGGVNLWLTRKDRAHQENRGPK